MSSYRSFLSTEGYLFGTVGIFVFIGLALILISSSLLVTLFWLLTCIGWYEEVSSCG